MSISIPNTPKELADAMNRIIPQLEVHGQYGPTGGGDARSMTVSMNLFNSDYFRPTAKSGKINGFDMSGGDGYFILRNQGILRELETLTKLMGGNRFSPSTEEEVKRFESTNRGLVSHIEIAGEKDKNYLPDGLALRMDIQNKFRTFLQNIDHIVYGLERLGTKIDKARVAREAGAYLKEINKASAVSAI